MDRKDFFSHAFKLLVGRGLNALEKVSDFTVLDKLVENENSKASPQLKQRPPGAVPEEEFLHLCTGCDACMIACPVNVIMIEDLEKRQPLIYPDIAPCVHCQGYPCITACPTGALSFASETKLTLINRPLA